MGRAPRAPAHTARRARAVGSGRSVEGHPMGFGVQGKEDSDVHHKSGISGNLGQNPRSRLDC